MQNSNDPRFTVIMCNYNYADYIEQAINSVLDQTYENYELIVVDDGSTDHSRDIIGSFHDRRIIKIYKENGGQASAFNHGFSIAKGEIISFLDSDDWWASEKLATLLQWHNYLEGNYSVLQHALNIWHDGVLRPYKNILPVGDCFEEMRKTGKVDFFVPTSGLSFKKTILEKVFPIPEKFHICADAYIMRAAFVFDKVFSIPQALGFYRKHENTVFGNEKFDAKKFLDHELYPELNKFYKRLKIEFQFAVTQNEIDITPLRQSSLLERLLSLLK